MSVSKTIYTMAGVMLALGLSSCSTINNFLDTKRTVDYSKSETVKQLEVPPDLTAPEYDTSFDLPSGGTVSVAAMQSGALVQQPPTGGVVPVVSTSPQPVTAGRTGNLASIRTHDGQTVVQIHDAHQRAIIMSDIILERMGFTVLQRDVTRGVFEVQYNGDEIRDEAGSKGLLNRMFSFARNRKTVLGKGATLQINVEQVDGLSLLKVRDAKGNPLPANQNTTLVSMINNEFNR